MSPDNVEQIQPQEETQELTVAQQTERNFADDEKLIEHLESTLASAKESGNEQLIQNATSLLNQVKTSRNMTFLISEKRKPLVKRFLRDKKYAESVRKQATQRLSSTKKFAFPQLSAINSARLAFEEGSKSKQFKVFEAAFFVTIESFATQDSATAIARVMFSCKHLKTEGFMETQSAQIVVDGIRNVVSFYS